jgi:hypothetical protein
MLDFVHWHHTVYPLASQGSDFKDLQQHGVFDGCLHIAALV